MMALRRRWTLGYDLLLLLAHHLLLHLLLLLWRRCLRSLRVLLLLLHWDRAWRWGRLLLLNDRRIFSCHCAIAHILVVWPSMAWDNAGSSNTYYSSATV